METGVPCDAPGDGRRHHEREQRAAHREDQERGARVAEQDVLEHVGREQVLVACRVEGRDEWESDEREPRGEEERPVPTRMVGPPATTEAREGVREPERGDRRTRKDNRSRIPGRGELRDRCHTAESRFRVWRSPAAARPARASPAARSSPGAGRSSADRPVLGGDGLGNRLLALEHALESRHAARIERRARVLAEERDRLLVRPGRPVHPRGDQGVVDIAYRQDARVETDALGGEPSRIPRPSSRS